MHGISAERNAVQAEVEEEREEVIVVFQVSKRGAHVRPGALQGPFDALLG